MATLDEAQAAAIEAGASIDDVNNLSKGQPLQVTQPTAAIDNVPVGEEFDVDLEQILAGGSSNTLVRDHIPAKKVPGQVVPSAPVDPRATFDDPDVQEYWDNLRRGVGNPEIVDTPEPTPTQQFLSAADVFSPTAAFIDYANAPLFAPDANFNFYDHYDQIKQDVHPDYWATLAEAESEDELKHKLGKIQTEHESMDTIFAGNKVIGGAAVVAAILGDPTTALAGVGEIAMLTKLAGASRVRNALTGAATLGATTAAQESMIALARETVTADDVVAGTLIGSTLGAGIGAVFRRPAVAHLRRDIERISADTRDIRATEPHTQQPKDSAGAGYTAESTLVSRRFEVAAETVKLDRVAGRQAVRTFIADTRARIGAGVQKVDTSGLRVAKKRVAKAQKVLIATERAVNKAGRRAATKEFQKAEQELDAILTAQADAARVKQAVAELKEFKAKSFDDQLISIYGKDNVPTIARRTFKETEESQAARQVAEEPVAEAVAETDQLGAGSAGSMRVDTDESPLDITIKQADIIDDAESWVAANSDTLDARMGSRTGRAIAGMGKAGLVMDSSFFLRSKSAVGKHFGAIFLENGAGMGGRENTAAILKDLYERQILSDVMPQYRASYSAWAHTQGISKFNIKAYYGNGKADFDALLRTELETRRLNRTDDAVTNDQSVIDAADAWQKAMDRALDIMQKSGVRGADDIARVPGYVPLKWNGAKIRALPASTRLKYTGLLSKSYQDVLGVSREDANLMADAVLQRAMKKNLHLDSNPAGLLTGDARAELRSIFEDTGIDSRRLEELLGRIDGRLADRSKFQRLRRRNEVDLTMTVDGMRLMDLADNNLDVLMGRYAAETAGRSGMAKKGITSDSDWDTLHRTLITEMSAKDPTLKTADIEARINSVRSQMLGRPIGQGVNRNARRLTDLATLSLLGQVGFAQLAELGAVTGQLGMRTMLEEIPVMGRFLRGSKRGDVSQDLLDEIQTISGNIGDEHLLFRPEVRLEDAAADDPTWLTVVDKGLAAGQDMLGYASGMNHIKRMEQRLAVKVLAGKVARLARGETIGRVTPERLADVGWDAQKLERIKTMINKHAEFEGNVLQRLNLEDWSDPNLVEDFALGINRFTHQVVQRPMIGETAHWMHSTLGAMFTQFRHFPLVAMEKQLARNTYHSDMATFSTVTYGLGWSGMAYIAKTMANSPGLSEEDLQNRLSLDRIAKGAIQYNGTAAMLPDGMSVLAYAGVLPNDWAFSAGRTGGYKPSALGLQIVPSLGAAEDLINTLTIPSRSLSPWDDYEVGKADVSAVQGATILGNTVPANIIFGLMKQGVE